MCQLSKWSKLHIRFTWKIRALRHASIRSQIYKQKRISHLINRDQTARFDWRLVHYWYTNSLSNEGCFHTDSCKSIMATRRQKCNKVAVNVYFVSSQPSLTATWSWSYPLSCKPVSDCKFWVKWPQNSPVTCLSFHLSFQCRSSQCGCLRFGS